MKKRYLLTLLASALALNSQAAEKQKISLMLDWFVNPDHAALHNKKAFLQSRIWKWKLLSRLTLHYPLN